MKPAFILCLAGSLAGNIALLGLLVAGKASTDPAVPPPSPTAPVVSKTAPTTPAIDAKTWENLRSDELPTMVAQLRAAGFSPEIVRAIMAAHLRESFVARRKAIDPTADTRSFWKSTPMDSNVQLALRQLSREQEKLMRELLGPDAEPAENVMNIYQGRRLDGIGGEKLADVRRILREFDDARSDLYGAGGVMGTEQQKKITALEKDQRAKLAGVLTPQELADYELRNSDTSRNVRYQLSAFNATEDEFRTIYRLQAQFDDQFGRQYSILPPDEQRRRDEAQRQLNDQIKAALGPMRGADYERANDYYFRQTSQLVARLELPPETTQKIWEIQKEIQEKVGASSRPNPQQPNSPNRLAELATEAEMRVTALLGTRGFEAYKQYGGSWMQMLRPRPATGTPVPAR